MDSMKNLSYLYLPYLAISITKISGGIMDSMKNLSYLYLSYLYLKNLSLFIYLATYQEFTGGIMDSMKISLLFIYLLLFISLLFISLAYYQEENWRDNGFNEDISLI